MRWSRKAAVWAAGTVAWAGLALYYAVTNGKTGVTPFWSLMAALYLGSTIRAARRAALARRRSS